MFNIYIYHTFATTLSLSLSDFFFQMLFTTSNGYFFLLQTPVHMTKPLCFFLEHAYSLYYNCASFQQAGILYICNKTTIADFKLLQSAICPGQKILIMHETCFSFQKYVYSINHTIFCFSYTLYSFLHSLRLKYIKIIP